MEVFEVVIALLLGGAALAALARRVGAPYPALVALTAHYWRTGSPRTRRQDHGLARNRALTCSYVRWAMPDLNRRPLPCQGSALPLS